MTKLQENPKTTKKQAQSSIFDIPDSIIPEDKRIFTPHWGNRPPHAVAVVAVQGKRALTTGNMMVIASVPGTGKSGLCEAICAKYLNPLCDGLGFEVNLPIHRNKILYLDTERTRIDTWNGWNRMMQRAEIANPEIDKRVLFNNLKAVPITDRRKYVVEILNQNPDIGLILFDGGGDFIRDTNSISESIEFIDWINTFNPAISLLVTIHTNPKDNKPRGHAGSELMRRAESVFLLRKLEDGIKEITTDYEFGKVRNDSDGISVFFSYSDDAKMFVSVEYEKPVKKAKSTKDVDYQTLLDNIKDFHREKNPERHFNYSYIVEQLVQMNFSPSKSAAQKYATRNLIPLIDKSTDI
jgi:hypothetical protein